MKTNKIRTTLAVLLGMMALTSCHEVADEMLDLAGANSFDKDDTIIEQKTQKDVQSSTITGHIGDRIVLYIANINDKIGKGYSKAKWASDDTSVATVSPDTGNATAVTLHAEGIAMITVTDIDGNMMTVNVSCVAYDDDSGYDDGGGDNGGYDDGGDDDGGYDDGGGDDGGYDDGGGDDGGYDDGGGDDGGYDDGGGDDNGGDNGGYDDGGDPDIFDTNDAILD
ncbi:MAG: Ig-like domain-containing protein [Prevotella sp.]|nr:Ig-like domain-containing protein [Prevotella sp.]